MNVRAAGVVAIVMAAFSVAETMPSRPQGDLTEQLAEALRRSDAVSVRRLLDVGADVNAKLVDGVTPLMVAADCGAADLVELLIKAGAAVDEHDRNGFTALMFAAGRGDFRSAEALLEAGADPTFRNPVSGATAAEIATGRSPKRWRLPLWRRRSLASELVIVAPPAGPPDDMVQLLERYATRIRAAALQRSKRSE